jgi:hypothetical protein
MRKQIRDVELENYSIDSIPHRPKNLKFTAKDKLNLPFGVKEWN